LRWDHLEGLAGLLRRNHLEGLAALLRRNHLEGLAALLRRNHPEGLPAELRAEGRHLERRLRRPTLGHHQKTGAAGIPLYHHRLAMRSRNLKAAGLRSD
jgi:hypothetical protein